MCTSRFVLYYLELVLHSIIQKKTSFLRNPTHELIWRIFDNLVYSVLIFRLFFVKHQFFFFKSVVSKEFQSSVCCHRVISLASKFDLIDSSELRELNTCCFGDEWTLDGKYA